jgi:hypothetical protein
MVFARGITEMSNSIKAYLEAAQLIRAAFDEGFTEGAEYYRSPEVEQEAWAQSLAKEAFDELKAVTSAVVPEPFGTESAYQAAKKSTLFGANMLISRELMRELVEAVRNSASPKQEQDSLN